MTGQSLELTRFYRAYQTWLNEGAHNHLIFRRSSGLCATLHRWADNQLIDDYNALNEELVNQFVEADLNPKYPFGGESQYYKDWDRSIMHRNEHRRAWVTLHA